MAISTGAGASYRRKSAERAPGDIDLGRGKDADVKRTPKTRTNTRTVAKTFSIPVDVYANLENYMFEHRERSASKLVSQAIAEFIGRN